MAHKNISMNHYNGDMVRQQWPVGMEVNFEPKGWMSGDQLSGIVVGHMYVNVLIIESGNTKWWVSTFRAWPKTEEKRIEPTLTLETTIIRSNLMTQQGYTPYCGNPLSTFDAHGCNNPRTRWNGEQFACPHCGWLSSFPPDFIARYKEKWNK